MLNMIFQYGWEPVLIQWILIGLTFEAILEILIIVANINTMSFIPNFLNHPHSFFYLLQSFFYKLWRGMGMLYLFKNNTKELDLKKIYSTFYGSSFIKVQFKRRLPPKTAVWRW